MVRAFEVGLARISLTSVGRVGFELEGWVSWRVLLDFEWSKETSAVMFEPEAEETLEMSLGDLGGVPTECFLRRRAFGEIGLCIEP